MRLFYYFLCCRFNTDHLWTPQRWRMWSFSYISRHRLRVIPFCLISSNHIGKYFRRCYRRRDLCRFNHPTSCFSGKRKQASQHMVTEWNALFTDTLNGIALMVQHLYVKQHWLKRVERANEITFQKRVYSQEQGLTVKNRCFLLKCINEKYFYTSTSRLELKRNTLLKQHSWVWSRYECNEVGPAGCR